MTGTLLRRLARLEGGALTGAVLHVWEGAGADAVARQFSEGMPAGTTIIVYQWAAGEQAEAPPDGGA